MPPLRLGNPGRALADHWALAAVFLGFYLVVRPAVLGLNTAAASVRLEPNLFPLILSRLHRFTIGQAVTFFDNDFAGRIAQKQMQTARAATDVVSGTVETVAFALSSVVGSVILLGAIDAWVSLLLVLWVTAYILFIRAFLKRIRSASAKRAAARAMVTGQIVDTVTNMKTVKLFAHAEHEDAVALDAMSSFRSSAISYGMLSSWFRFGLTVLAGILPVLSGRRDSLDLAGRGGNGRRNCSSGGGFVPAFTDDGLGFLQPDVDLWKYRGG